MLRLASAALVASALTSCTSSTAGTAHAGPAGERVPVIVELFSSEGCSSCPPADEILAAIAKGQAVPGAEVIALELHVDYWNYLGWSDPFSSPAFTARQRAYATAFGQRGVYTPQLVIDGRRELVGSNREGAVEAIGAAAKAPRGKVQLARGEEDRLRVTIGELPESTEAATVWLALTEEGIRTPVTRGENAGATLAHGPVVRRLAPIGAIVAGARAFSGEARLALDPAWKRAALRAVVFVARDRSLAIDGAGALSLR